MNNVSSQELSPRINQSVTNGDHVDNSNEEPQPWTEQQRRAIFGPIMAEYCRQKKCSREEANQWFKDALVKRGMIKDSRTEMTKQNAAKVIDGLCKQLDLELDSPWL